MLHSNWRWRGMKKNTYFSLSNYMNIVQGLMRDTNTLCFGEDICILLMTRGCLPVESQAQNRPCSWEWTLISCNVSVPTA